MIRREITIRPDEVIATFDHFNDYHDTKRYLEGIIDHATKAIFALARLAAEHKIYQERRIAYLKGEKT